MGGVEEEDMGAEEKLTSEQTYQRQYYRDHITERKDYAQDRWENDREYRRREMQRAKDRRAQERAGKASDRFRAMVDERRGALEETRTPVRTWEGDENVMVFTAGSLAREIGRSKRAVGAWLRDGTLPGATVFLDVRCENGRVVRKPFFSKQFGGAVYRACEQLFYLNGRGEKKVLKRLIRDEMTKTKIIYVPYAHRGDNSVHVRSGEGVDGP